MHSQINLLRRTILDLQQTEAHEMADLRRHIDVLENPSAGDVKARFEDIDSRLQAVEQQPRGGMVRDSLNTGIFADQSRKAIIALATRYISRNAVSSPVRACGNREDLQ